MTEVFLDTSYAIAMLAPSDQLHKRAVALAQKLWTEKTHVVTTQAVLLEIGNSLSGRRYRAAAVGLLASMEIDPLIEVIPLSPELYSKAFDLYRSRPDKEWGLVDCVSFIVMKERGISGALTADEYFGQAGFRALLRDP